MIPRRFASLAGGIACALCLAGAAHANTYVVDDDGGPGVTFTDLPQAIAGTVTGDTIVVRDGTYSGFTVTTKRVILGGPNVVVTSRVTIDGVPFNTSLTISGMTFPDFLDDAIVVSNCVGAVILEAIDVQRMRLVAQGSGDVRVRASTIHGRDGSNHSHPTSLTGGTAIALVDSRIEVVESVITGGRGHGCVPCTIDSGAGSDGGPAIWAEGASDVHVARSNVTGGAGGDSSPSAPSGGAYGGYGAPALRVGTQGVSGAVRALVTGRPEHVLAGGAGGTTPPGPLNFDGSPGDGVDVFATSQARTSGATIQGAVAVFVESGGVHEIASPDDPTMWIGSAALIGQPLTFHIHAPAGSNVVLHMSRRARVTPVAGLDEDLLTFTPRVLPIGVVPPGDEITKTFTIPTAGIAPGLVLHAQAVATLPGGTVRRTHSIPLVLR